MMERRAARASSILMLPFMALAVQAETSGPLPSVSARTSCEEDVVVGGRSKRSRGDGLRRPKRDRGESNWRKW